MEATAALGCDGAAIGELEQIEFAGGTIAALIDQEGAIWIALGLACAALGIDWRAQRKRLQEWAWSVLVVKTAAARGSKPQGLTCLRGDRLAMWLATISAHEVRPELRERLTLWQCEAADALSRWAADCVQSPPPAPSPALALTPELRQLVAQEVRTVLQQEYASAPLSQPGSQALAYGILLRRPVVSGWPQLALGVRQCCRFLKTDCLTSAKMAELLAHDVDAVTELAGAVEKLTGRRTLSGRQLGYLLSCAQKRGLVENDGRLHSYGGYGWSALDRPADPAHPQLNPGLTQNVFPLFPSPVSEETVPDLLKMELGQRALECLGQAVEQACRRLDSGQVTAAELARLMKSDPESIPGLLEVARYLGSESLLSAAGIGYLLRSAQKKAAFTARRVGKGRMGTQWSPRAWLMPAPGEPTQTTTS